MKQAIKSVVNGVLGAVNLQMVTRREESSHLYGQCLSEALAGIDTPTVVDVGAHEGQMLREIKAINGASRILAIEPQPAIFGVLEQLGAEQGFKSLNLAVGDEEGALDFHIFPESQCSSLLPGGDTGDGTAPYLEREVEVIRVPVRRLDDLLREQGMTGTIDYLKIDVQGYEDRVLRGARETLARTRFVMIELQFKEVYKGCCLVDEGCHLLRQAGFHLIRTVGYLPGARVNELVSSDFFFKRGD